jgi:PAS domain S-box-containing protein
VPLLTIAAVLIAAVAVGAALRARRAAARARASRGRYETLAAHLPDVAVLLFDRDLRFTLVEGRALEHHGWRREEIEGRPIAEVIPAPRADQLLERCRAALAGESGSHAWPGIRDGASYVIQHAPLRDARGAVSGGMLVVRDVTHAGRLQREVDEQRGFMATVLEQLPYHVLACDAEGRLRLGAEDSDVDPLDWASHFRLHRLDGRTPLTAEEAPLFRALHGETVTGAELVMDQPGAGLRRLNVSARPVVDAAGRSLGAVAAGVDVTERREAEARLQASEERYRSVVESVGDTVFGADMRGRWTFLNESWAQWTGIPVAEALGRPVDEIVHPEDRADHARAFAPLVGGQVEAVRVRHRYLTAEGVTRWAEVRARLAYDADGLPLGVAGVIEDVSERHRTQQYEAAEQAVVEVLEHAHDIEEGVPALLEALCRHLDWDLAELWTLDEQHEVLRCTDAAGERRAGLEAFEAARAGLAFEIGDGLPGQVWARRAPIWLTTLHDDPLFCRPAPAVAAGLRAALALPITRGAEVLATIQLFTREQREPDPGLARLLGAISAHLAQFLERRRLERLLAEPAGASRT